MAAAAPSWQETAVLGLCGRWAPADTPTKLERLQEGLSALCLQCTQELQGCPKDSAPWAPAEGAVHSPVTEYLRA